MVIGADVTVGENTVIERSVIGDGCRIGASVTIVDSYMWAGSEVHDRARLEGAVLASRAMATTPAGEFYTSHYYCTGESGEVIFIFCRSPVFLFLFLFLLVCYMLCCMSVGTPPRGRTQGCLPPT